MRLKHRGAQYNNNADRILCADLISMSARDLAPFKVYGGDVEDELNGPGKRLGLGTTSEVYKASALES